MGTFYVFNEYGDFQSTIADEDYVPAWCEEQPSLKKNKKVLKNC